MTIPEKTETLDLAERFPGAVSAEARPGYSGWVVTPEKLVEFGLYVRDDLGYDLLSSVVAVDYLADNKMEVVYYAYKTTGGPGIVWRVQVPRVDPIEVDSLTPVWPGAEYQEREIYDLYGIIFRNHPDLRRMFMWEGFEGYPMRRDWKEPFYEEDFKPFKSRGQGVLQSEDKSPFSDNIQFDRFRLESGRGTEALSTMHRYKRKRGRRDTDPHWSTWARSTSTRRFPRGNGHQRRDGRQPQAGARIFAPQPRDDRRTQHLPAKHPLHRPT
jgi:NADH:ubiquinone oxidoreductase subunit C